MHLVQILSNYYLLSRWAVCSRCAARCRFHLSHNVFLCPLGWHQLLCHQTSCAPTSQKSQSSPLKSLCPSHFCFNHHQRPSQRAIFARALRPAILVCSDGAPTWWIEEASARGRRTHTRGHREALVLLRPALARALLEAEADHVTAGTVEYLARPPERTALLPVLRERCLQPHPGQLTTTAPLQRRKTTKAIMAACISLPHCLGMQQR